MSKQVLNQRYVYKITSSYLKRNKYNITIDDTQKAIKTRMVVGIGDSTGTRMIRKISKSEATEEKINEIKNRINKNKRLISNKLNNVKELKKQIKDDIDKKYDLMLEKNLCNVVFTSMKHYEKIVKDGFKINDIKYKLLLGTSGGIKNNTVLFINEDYYDEVWKCLQGDMDNSIPMLPSKLMAYMALTFSSSTPVTNTKKILVVKDVETTFRDKVTTISMNDEDIQPKLKEEEIDVKVNACDGCGMITSELAELWSKDLQLDYISPAYCVRNLWVKGMLSVFDFKKYCKEVIGKEIVTDVWGQEHNINDIDIILNESMLKCTKMYSSLDEYLTAVENNNYEFAATKYVHKEIDNRRMLNYQYTQCLNLSDDDIDNLLVEDMNEIKDVLGLNQKKSIIFGKGSELNDDNVWYEAEDDLHIKALMINEEAIHDDYIRNKIKRAILKRIKMLKTSKINVDGNYQLIIGEPVIQLESMFGLKPKGLLKSGEFYIEYWREKGINKVASFRSPMSCKENARIMGVVDDENINKWYGHLRGLIILNAWDTTMMAENGADCDGDLSFTTSNKIILNGIYVLPAINCIGNTSDKKAFITREDYINAIASGFGNQVGSVTNFGSSCYDTISMFEEVSEEYKEIDYRIKCIQYYQQECIDSAKNGKPPKPLPKIWSEFKEVKDLDEDDINRKVLTEKKPYFFRYIYDDINKEYNKFIKNTNENCIDKFRCTVEELKANDNKTEEEEEFLMWYNKKNPLSENGCIVNKMAKIVEKNFDDERTYNKNKDFDWSIYTLKDEEVDISTADTIIKQIKSLNKEYLSKIKTQKTKSKESNYSSYQEDMKLFKDNMLKICSDENLLCYILLYLSYEKSIVSKSFAWLICGETIIENMLKNSNYIIHYPRKSDKGDIRYGGNLFEMVEKDLKDKGGK